MCKKNQFVHSLLWYNSAQVRSLLYQVKHRADREQIDFLAERLAAICTEYYDAVTYVPRDRRNLKKNGYDQAKLLAEAVAGHLQLPVVCTLSCNSNVQQKLLSASQREKAAKEKYQVKSEAVAAYPRLLLVDDICTTGATLRACSSLLRKSGAKAVFCAALAKTELELLPHI